jgi:predicted Fe-Mo cluster-binding NifX family protein
MKIAVASSGKNEDSEISEQAGRSPYYLIFNGRGELVETISNPFSLGGGGAGFGVAKMLADKGVDVVIAGKFGKNIIEAMKARGLRFMEMSGSPRQAVSKIIKE